TGADPRRDRRRQGARREADSPSLVARAGADGASELRGAARVARRERALRARTGRVLRGDGRQNREIRACARGHAVSGRGRRAAARRAGEAPSRIAERRNPAADNAYKGSNVTTATL